MIKDTMKAYGYTHSFVKALKAASHDIKDLPIETIATGCGMALRTIVHKDLCPSAMSVFDWNLLKVGTNNLGFESQVITRMWEEDHLEVERRQAAHQMIVDSKYPIIAWDLSVPEWEVIKEVDEEHSTYKGVSVTGANLELDFDKLGRREIPVLFVMTITGWNEPQKLIDKLLNIIVDHNEGKEAIALPDYKEGYEAYDHWINKMTTLESDDFDSRYYFETYKEMKEHAAKYFQEFAKKDETYTNLSNAFNELAKVYENLLSYRNMPDYPDNRDTIISELKSAKAIEKRIYKEAKTLL